MAGPRQNRSVLRKSATLGVVLTSLFLSVTAASAAESEGSSTSGPEAKEGTVDLPAGELPAAPSENRVAEPSPLPPPSARINTLIVGGTVLTVSYGIAFGTSSLWYDSDAREAWRLPVIGPWMAFPKLGCAEAESGCGTAPVVVRSVLTGLSALGQTGGLLMLVEGLLMSTDSGESNSSVSRRDRWIAAPIVTDRSLGLILHGSF